MQTTTAILDKMLRWNADAFEGDEEVNGGDMVEAFAEWRAEIKAALAVRAMALYQLDPGHSDLDNEQPMSVKVGGADYRCTLGDIRKAQREAYEQRNAVARLIAAEFTPTGAAGATTYALAQRIMSALNLPLPVAQ